jgi:hypothetical protein
VPSGPGELDEGEIVRRGAPLKIGRDVFVVLVCRVDFGQWN